MKKKYMLIASTVGFVAGVLIVVVLHDKMGMFSNKGDRATKEAAFEKQLNQKTEDFLSQITKSDENEQLKKKLFTQFVQGTMIASEFAVLNSMLESQLVKMQALQSSPEKKTMIANAFKDVFDANAIYESYMKSLYEQLTTDELKELNEVYANPNVAKTVKAMQHLRTPAGQKEFQDYTKTLAAKPITEQRKAELNRFDQVSGMSVNSAKLITQIMTLMQISDNNGKNKGNIVKQAEEQKHLESYMTARVHEGVLLSLAKAHSELNDQEMQEVLALRSKPTVLKEGKIRFENITNYISSARAKSGYEALVQAVP